MLEAEELKLTFSCTLCLFGLRGAGLSVVADFAGLDAGRAHPELYGSAHAVFNPEDLEVGHEAALGAPVGVGDAVAGLGLLPAYLAVY